MFSSGNICSSFSSGNLHTMAEVIGQEEGVNLEDCGQATQIFINIQQRLCDFVMYYVTGHKYCVQDGG